MMNLKAIVIFLIISNYALYAQASISNEGLIVSMLSRIESLEKRVRFLEEQLMRQAQALPMFERKSVVRAPSKVGEPVSKESKITKPSFPASRYEKFFLKNVAQPSWKIKKISCKPDYPNKKVECTAEFRVTGKVGRKARQVVKGLVLLNPNSEPIRVFKF